MGSVVVVSVVRDLLTRLGGLGVDAEFFNNAGGVMVVRAAFGEWVPDESNRRYEVLVTPRDDSFEMYSSDDEMTGLLATLVVNDDNGESAAFIERSGPVVLYCSSDRLISVDEFTESEEVLPPGGFSVVSMSTEVRECTDAVAFIVRAVESAESEGRSKGRILLDPTNAVVPFSRG